MLLKNIIKRTLFLFCNFFFFFFLHSQESEHLNLKIIEEKRDQIFNICIATDDNYAQHAAVTIASILKNSLDEEKFRIFVLHKGLSKKTIKKLEKLKTIKNFELIFKKVDKEKIKKLFVKNSHLSIESWFRLFIPTLCTECKEDRILYLDVDIVVTKSLRELFSLDLKNYFVAAVQDFKRPPEEYLENTLKINPPYNYFNSGVIMFNLENCCKNNIFQKSLEYAINNSHKILFEDQDALNYSCNNHVLYLPLKYNLQSASVSRIKRENYYKGIGKNIDEALDAVKNPTIIHFANKGKPWKFFSNHPLRNEYYKYLRYTPWKSEESIIANIRYSIIMYLKNIYYKIFTK